MFQTLEKYGGKFVPLAMETYGRLGPSCISFIRELTSIENAPDLDNPLMDEMELNPSTLAMVLYGSISVAVQRQMANDASLWITQCLRDSGGVVFHNHPYMVDVPMSLALMA